MESVEKVWITGHYFVFSIEFMCLWLISVLSNFSKACVQLLSLLNMCRSTERFLNQTECDVYPQILNCRTLHVQVWARRRKLVLDIAWVLESYIFRTAAPAGPGEPGVPASPRGPWAPSAPRAPVGPASPCKMKFSRHKLLLGSF